MAHSERTLILVKPDGIRRQLVGRILGRFETAELAITALELTYPDESRVETHYQEHQEASFFPHLIEYLVDKPVVAAVLSGADAVSRTRAIIGDTDPAVAEKETIRGDLGTDAMAAADAENRALRNLVHGSADPAAAETEIDLWFPDRESEQQ